MSFPTPRLEVPSIISATDTFSSGSTVPGIGSISGKAIKRLGEAVLNGVDYFLINRELTRIEAHFRRGPVNKAADTTQNVEGMCHTLFEFTHPGYTKSVRARALSIIMKQIGGMNFKVLARALVDLDSWSTTYRNISSSIECTRRWNNDYYAAGYNSYRNHRKGGLLETDAITLYLALVALIGSRGHCQMILDLVSSGQELADGALKRVLQSRMGMEDDDPLLSDAMAVLNSSVFDDEPSYFYPYGHVSKVLAKTNEILSYRSLNPVTVAPSEKASPPTREEHLVDPHLKVNRGIIEGGTLRALLEFLISPQTPSSYVSLNLKVFAMTFRTFTTVDELFDLLSTRLQESPPVLEASPLEEDRSKVLLRSRVISILTAITEEGVLETECSMQVLARVESLFVLETIDLSMHNKAQALLGTIRRSRIANHQSQEPSEIAAHGEVLPEEGTLSIHTLLGSSCVSLATQLTMMESSLYLSLHPIDCLRHRRQPSKNILALVDFNNAVTKWTQSYAMQGNIATIGHLVSVAEECRILRNYSSMVSIVSGLGMVEERLGADSPIKDEWERCQALALRMQTPQGFHDVMKTGRSSPAIPVIGHFLAWLRAIESQHEDMLPGTQEIIDFRKRWKLYNAVDHFLWWQKYPHNLSKSPEIQQYLSEHLARITKQYLQGVIIH